MNTNLAGSPRPVLILPYNTGWPGEFTKEAARIQAAAGQFFHAIHHIGSTSVPGLAAKPIIDMLIGLKSLDDTPRFVPLLVDLGYRYFPEHEMDLPERRYFSRVVDDSHGFHLHMVEPDSAFYRRHLAFRDYLRTHPDARDEYAALKIGLAAQYGSDREGYTDAKTEFIQRIEKLALAGDSTNFACS